MIKLLFQEGVRNISKLLDLVWSKPFKAICTQKYDEWLAEEGILNETAKGNLKAPPRKRIVQWILDSNEVIKKSFKSCGLNINVDGSEDDVIHCLKQAQPCAAGREMLKSQMDVLKDLENETNPFSSSAKVTDSDLEEAGNEIFILDEDESEDELIDLEQI